MTQNLDVRTYDTSSKQHHYMKMWALLRKFLPARANIVFTAAIYTTRDQRCRPGPPAAVTPWGAELHE